VIKPAYPVSIYIIFISHSELETGKKNTNEKRVITDYMQDISKFCRLWLSKTYTAKVIKLTVINGLQAKF
jgi:hypothetical protein